MMLDWADTEYIGLGYVTTSAVVSEELVIVAAEVCITLAPVTQLDITLSPVTTLAVTLAPVTQLDITLILPEC